MASSIHINFERPRPRFLSTGLSEVSEGFLVQGDLATWVGLTLIWMFHSFCPATQPILPNSHQPKQNRADSGTVKIQVNPTQVAR